MRESSTFVRGANFDNIFLVDVRGSAYHYKLAIECWFSSIVIFRVTRSVLLRNPIFL